MPKNKIFATKRARAAIAAVIVSVTGTVGGVLYVEKTPAAIVLTQKTLVQPWEGRKLKAYKDIVGVVTICDGDTENVKMGMVETPAGCDRRLEKRLKKDFYPALVKCIPGFAVKPLSWQAAMVSLAYNVGNGAACKSTAARLGKQNKYYDSCIAATAFNKAGGKVVNGLVKRREMGDTIRIGEAELCVSGLSK